MKSDREGGFDVVMEGLVLRSWDFFVVAPRWGDVTSLTCVL